MTEHPVSPQAEDAGAAPAGRVESRGTTLFWLGILLIGVLAIAILVLLQIREVVTPRVEPTPLPGIADIQPRQVADFTLPATTGGDLSLSDILAGGDYAMIFFGYTHCPDFCPLTLAEYRLIKRQLGELADRVTFVFISVDPARDTPELLRQFVRSYDPDFIGMTGDDVTLAQITPDFGLFYERHEDEGPNYIVDHSTSSYLIDPQRRLRTIISYGAEPDVISAHIRDVILADQG
ncbi:MAG: SCO family protein [Anaerolinea sp.]|nr:SCO family protein [Anaerolinea sp.]